MSVLIRIHVYISKWNKNYLLYFFFIHVLAM